ncbi:MAG: hypothetical protein WBW88_02945, partial [Rhodothermales bacterium]
EILEFTDLVMMDLKLMSPDKHRAATGSSNERILENAVHLAKKAVPIVFRTPIVPTVNDDPEEFGQIAAFVGELVHLRAEAGNGVAAAPITLELLPFHKLAGDKYRSLGMEYRAANFDTPTQETMNTLARLAEDSGLQVRTR